MNNNFYSNMSFIDDLKSLTCLSALNCVHLELNKFNKNSKEYIKILIDQFKFKFFISL
jgi:hypothetical protein